MLNYVPLFCRLFIGIVFALSAASKIREFEEFVRATRSLLEAALPRLRLGRRGLRAVASTVLAAETAICPFVVVSPWWPLGLAASSLLLTLFTAAIAFALRRGVRAPCRCFGGSATPLGKRHLFRNAALLTATVAGLALPYEPESDPAGLAVVIMAAAVAAMVTSRLDDIVGLFATPTTR
ncbi:MauE/DoxX family redox-associated membrane protein [Planobispora takensis]|uniref:Methylamine utilization protein MauE n=1 Tax=Planobispora takensis TaxID=1367882 RepID=A0A8J3WSV5_9ACTN|nr:MauE/DoxX family redox-associated membrane protein [Planobispora takensis]GII01089.1 methylamine utilization protein MauE [Planobispora takensis]